MYFRFAVIYVKQSRGTNPTPPFNPDFFASGPAIAINQFRLPATTQRYEVLHDQTYSWLNGELTTGLFEITGVGEPFWVQNGLCAKEEIFVECEKLVRYSAGSSSVADIVSGNIFYMLSSVGGDCNITVTSRTTYSDNL